MTTRVSPHPELMQFRGSFEMVLVQDQPVLDRLYHGAPDLGWAGDPMLAVYAWPKRDAFVVLRLIAGDEYDFVMQVRGLRPLSPGSVNQVIRKLIEVDRRRGFDGHAAVVAHNDRVEAEQVRRNDEWVEEEMAPRLAWAYGRDRATHLGGRFDHHVVPAVPWKEPTAAGDGESSAE